MLMGEVFNED